MKLSRFIGVAGILALSMSMGCDTTSSGPDLEAPSTPILALAQPPSDGQVFLTWSRPPERDLVGYNLFRSTKLDLSDREFIRWFTKDTLTYSESGLEYDTTYRYQISAFDNVSPTNESELSVEIQVRPSNSTAPPQPDSLIALASNILTPQIKLTWKGVEAPDLAGYLLYRNELPQFPGPDSGIVVETAAADPTRFIDGSTLESSVDVGRHYYYWVVAIDRGYPPRFSSPASKMTYDVALPHPVLIGPADGSDVSSLKPTFSWQEVPLAAGYKIILQTASFGGEKWNVTMPKTQTHITYSGPALTSKTQYFWRIITTTQDNSDLDNSISDLWSFHTP